MNEELRELLAGAVCRSQRDGPTWNGRVEADAILEEIEAAGYAVVPMAKYLDDARAALIDAGWVIVRRERVERLQRAANAGERWLLRDGADLGFLQPGDLEPLP